jgi:hypothetical protein
MNSRPTQQYVKPQHEGRLNQLLLEFLRAGKKDAAQSLGNNLAMWLQVHPKGGGPLLDML